jgi:hypothetical protein
MAGWLALAVLALQLAMSFGHVHFLEPASDRASIHATTPDQPEGDLGTGHDCPLCTVRQMAGTPVMAGTPALQLPASYRNAPPPVPASRIGPAVDATAFHARGPPQA